MTGAALLIAFDADLDAVFQRALCAGLDALQVGYADASAIDADPETPPVIDLYVVSAARGGTGAVEPPHALMVIGGPGGREHAGRAMRLETHDIETGSRRWAVLAGRIGERIGRAGLGDYLLASGDDERRLWALAHPRDPLAADLAESQKPEALARRLSEETRRADEAVAALQRLQRDADVTAIDHRRAETSVASTHARMAALEAENARLRAHLDTAAFALSLAPPEVRDAMLRARDAEGLARIAAAEADALAARHAGALVWPRGDASYAGETKNRHPHGRGAMAFVRSGAFYRGDFVEGRREGLGVGRSEDGSVWSGQWANNEACGFGILETADGRRFEGEVRPGDGGPRRADGYVWPGPGRQGEPITLRAQQAARLLPAS